jgi:hypothetical protein
MKIIAHQLKNSQVAEIVTNDTIIQNIEDSLDLLGNLYYQQYDQIILQKHQITDEFFDLKNGMAGEILQKYSNYRIKLAIVGDFSSLTSNSLKDFIFESNKNGQIIFVSSTEEALSNFSR